MGLRRRKLILVAVVATAALEAVLWVIAPQPDDLSRRGTRLHRFLPGWSYYGDPPVETSPDYGRLNGVTLNEQPVKINRYGFLYPEENAQRAGPGEYRIAVLGGSTVEGIALRPENRWPALLERRLESWEPARDVTVLNLGISAQATWTHLANVGQHVVDLDVDLIVLLIGANDLVRARADYENMLIPSMFAANPDLSPALAARWLVMRTQTGRWLRKGYLAIGREGPQEPYFQPTVRLLHSVPELPFEPDYKPEAIENYEKSIVSIAAIARAHGIDVLFLTQPMLWREDDTPEERNVFWLILYEHEGRPYKLKPGAAANMLEKLNARLLDTCRRRALQCLDLAAAVPRSLEFFYDDLHFNDRGAAVVADTVASATLPTLRAARSRGSAD